MLCCGKGSSDSREGAGWGNSFVRVKVGRLWEIMMVLHMLLSRECKKNVTQGARGLDILS